MERRRASERSLASELCRGFRISENRVCWTRGRFCERGEENNGLLARTLSARTGECQEPRARTFAGR